LYYEKVLEIFTFLFYASGKMSFKNRHGAVLRSIRNDICQRCQDGQ